MRGTFIRFRLSPFNVHGLCVCVGGRGACGSYSRRQRFWYANQRIGEQARNMLFVYASTVHLSRTGKVGGKGC